MQAAGEAKPPAVFHCGGRSGRARCGVADQRTATKCAKAAADEREASGVRWDMTTFFQMVRHGRLNRAAATGFHLRLERLTVSLYRCERRLCNSKAINPAEVKPNRRVALGCGFATTIAKM